jgi:hypothetical protein
MQGGIAGVRASVPFLAASALIAAFVVFKHRSNITRIKAGTESKVLQARPRQGDAPDRGSPREHAATTGRPAAAAPQESAENTP